MFKTVVTLLRGQAWDAEERLADRHALSILDQQMRDASPRRRAGEKGAGAGHGAGSGGRAQARRRPRRGRRTRGARHRGAEGGSRRAGRKGRRGHRRPRGGRAGGGEGARRSSQPRSAGSKAMSETSPRALPNSTAGGGSPARPRRCGSPGGDGWRRPPARRRRSPRPKRRSRGCVKSRPKPAPPKRRSTHSTSAPRAQSVNETLAEAGFGPPVKPRAADVLARLKEKAGVPA